MILFTHGQLTDFEDPEIHKVVGKSDPIEVMAALREMKNKS